MDPFLFTAMGIAFGCWVTNAYYDWNKNKSEVKEVSTNTIKYEETQDTDDEILSNEVDYEELNVEEVVQPNIKKFDRTKPLIDELMEQVGGVFFITGKAGSGKTTLLKDYYNRTTNENVVKLAPTGVAAVGIGGVTIHSFFQIPFQIILNPQENEALLKGLDFYNYKNKLENLDCLLIDEISMVRPDLLDSIDVLLRLAKNSSQPFGGVKVIMFGDMLQLPPVLKKSEQQVILSKYKNPYFYAANVIGRSELVKIVLPKTYRQTDPAFIAILDSLRIGNITDDQLEVLNSRVISKDNKPDINQIPVFLCSTNNQANMINHEALEKNPNPSYIYKATLVDKFKEDDSYAINTLELKEDTFVTMLTNNKNYWANGDTGIVRNIGITYIEIEINGMLIEVQKHTWEKIQYNFDTKTKRFKSEVVGKLTQYPMKPTYAVTIHKSQGKTLDCVILNLDSDLFINGQLYVALSRVTDINGLFLTRNILRKDIIVNKELISISN